MSNVTPQVPDFNRGIWKKLETDLREWVVREHRLIIIAGPVFNENRRMIGQVNDLRLYYWFLQLKNFRSLSDTGE